jgi:hypothetical protein
MGVTADLSKYSSLEDFYEKTAGSRKCNLNDDVRKGGLHPQILACPCAREYPDTIDPHDVCFTITVASGK